MIKRIILLAFIAIMMAGCNHRVKEQFSLGDERIRHENRWHGFVVIVVDDCEYIMRTDRENHSQSGYGWGYMAHKGNCKYCAERSKQEKKQGEIEYD